MATITIWCRQSQEGTGRLVEEELPHLLQPQAPETWNQQGVQHWPHTNQPGLSGPNLIAAPKSCTDLSWGQLQPGTSQRGGSTQIRKPSIAPAFGSAPRDPSLEAWSLPVAHRQGEGGAQGLRRPQVKALEEPVRPGGPGDPWKAGWEGPGPC